MASGPMNNEELVTYLEMHNMVRTPEVIAALRAIDRGDFATPDVHEHVYLDEPIRSGDVHLSAPFIYAAALEEFGLQPGMSFLNIGSGTGYFSYVVSMLIGEGGINHGIERNPVLVRYCSDHIANANEKLCRQVDVQVLHGNGMLIDPSFRYDRVYVGAGCNSKASRDFLCNLLAEGGVLVAPFFDKLVKVKHESDGTFVSSNLCEVRFSPMVMPTEAERVGGERKPIRFVLEPWSPLCHHVYPKPFRKTVTCILAVNNRKDSLPGTLPPVVWMKVMSFARRDWFPDREEGPVAPGRSIARGAAAAAAEMATGVAGAAAEAVKEKARACRRCVGVVKSVALLPFKSSTASQPGGVGGEIDVTSPAAQEENGGSTATNMRSPFVP